MNFFKSIAKIFRWLGTALEDKAGSISSKRLIMFWGMYVLTKMSNNPTANEALIWPVIALILGAAGITIPEWFSKLKSNKNE